MVLITQVLRLKDRSKTSPATGDIIRRQFRELVHIPVEPSTTPPPPYITPPPPCKPIAASTPSRSSRQVSVTPVVQTLFKDLLDILALGLASVLPAAVCLIVLLLLTVKALLKPRQQ